MDSLRFTIPEILSLMGVAQCVYILVYMVFRAGRLSCSGLPVLYFSLLGMAFALDFAGRFVGQGLPGYGALQLFAWIAGPPVSVLLAIQVAQITKAPGLKYYALLLVPPAVVALALAAAAIDPDCRGLAGCETAESWLVLGGQVGGALSLLSLWLAHRVWGPLYRQKSGRERYWVILALLVMNSGFLISLFGYYGGRADSSDLLLIRTVFGLGLIYLVMTSLFRIYPAAVRLLPASEQDETALSDRELELALKIEKLLEYDKVYQENGYARRDLARELEISEAALSKIVNLHFGKSLPQLLNEYRVADAKRLLAETEAEINVVAQEVGFNSVASFNRVFKDISGQAPGDFRRERKA